MSEAKRLQQIRHNLERRARVYHFACVFLRGRGFLEVTTPVRVAELAPEAFITPVASEDRWLITSPELHMKRLLAAGYERIFQISRCFRKGEKGRLHNPEFDLLEWYRANAGYGEVIHDTEELIVSIADALGTGTNIIYQGQKINLRPPWPKINVREAFLRYAGWDPTANFDQQRFDTDMATLVQPKLPTEHPTVLTEYPAQAASLSRLKPGNSAVAERAEVFIGGLELANAYSELNNAAEQRRRFESEIAHIEREQGIKMPMPERFLSAVGGMPLSGGIALGLERLVMLFCNTRFINEITAFTEDNI
ncbi:MAG: EF-P lysine aminoacylase GenX [Dehalococcoidia bacterium]|nr:EF-P lysine aminoacylase GenX [Dehalococcoidia bacterium]